MLIHDRYKIIIEPIMKLLPTRLETIFKLQYVVAGYLPIMVVSFFLFISVKGSLEERVKSDLGANSVHAAMLVETSFYRVFSFVKNLAKNPLFSSPEIQGEILKKEFSGEYPLFNYIDSIRIFFNNGSLLASSREELSIPSELKEWVKGVGVQSKEQISRVFLEGQERNPIVFIGVPLESQESTARRVLLAGINLKSLWRVANTIRFGETGKILLLDELGRYLGGVMDDRLLTDSGFPVSLNSGKSTIFDAVNDDGRKVIAGMAGIGVGSSFINMPEWRVVLTQEKSECYSIIYMIGSYLLFLLPLMLLLIFLFNLFSMKHLFGPLTLLENGMNRASGGDLSFRTGIRYPFEIASLSRKFDMMMGKLDDAQGRLLSEIREREKAQQKVLELNRSLEDKVIQRTREIVELKQFHENILKSLTTGVMVLDEKGGLQFMNPASEKLLGISFQTERMKNIQFIGLPQALKAVLLESLETRKNIESREIRCGDAGKRCDFGIKTSLLWNEDKLSGIIGVFNDITDRKRMEQELLQGEKMYSCGLLATGMAHDFNNILNRIRMASNILSKISKDEDSREFLSEMSDAVGEGQSMTRSLMELGKKDELSLVPVNLLSFFKIFQEKTESGMRDYLTSLDIVCPQEIHVLSEPGYLMRIFGNLFLNAEQAGGGNPVRVTIVAETNGNQCLIRMSDNGRGMPEEVVNHIFEPFYSTKIVSEKSGWGLGLSLVKSLLVKMRGGIEVKSREGVGTEFLIVLPLSGRIAE